METIGQLVKVLGAVVNLVHAPLGDDVTIESCSIVDSQDVLQLATDIDRSGDVVILVGADQRRVTQLVRRIASTGPSLILVKSNETSPHKFDGMPAAVAVVDAQVGWGQLHSIVDRVILDGRARRQAQQDGSAVLGTHTDLFGLANTLAAMTGGLVSIDDPQTRVLAFSPLDDSADDLRRSCIMGRSAPPEHVEELRRQGVFGRLRQSTEAFVLPATPTARERLCVGLHDETTSEYLGAIWVQEGAKPFKARARQTLQAGGLVASRLIDGSRRIPSQESELLRQLVGLKATSDSAEQLIAALKLPANSGWTIVGFSTLANPSSASAFHDVFTDAALGSLSLQAVSLRSTARAAYGGNVLYAVIPDAPGGDVVPRWAVLVVRMLARYAGQNVRAAIGRAVEAPSELPQARVAVDEILHSAHLKGSDLVVSYEEFETNLTLTRVFHALRSQRLIGESRLASLASLPHADGQALLSTLLTYFDCGGDFRQGAELLHIHPNTMRQRLRRIESATNLRLRDPEERLLLELEARAFEAA